MLTRIVFLAAVTATAGLVPVEKSSFDEALAKPGAFASAQAILLEPMIASYARRPNPSDPIYRKDEDWQYHPEDLERFHRAFREALEEALGEKGIAIVDKPGPGVLRVKPELVDVRLTAPLHEDAVVNKTFVKSIGDLTLVATFRDSASGEVVATVRDVRRNVEVAAAPLKGVRFTSTLYLSEVKRIFRRWADKTADLFPERKKP